jgi:putative transposase
MPRQARLDAPGTLHHVMIRGIEKRSIFNDDVDREFFITRMGQLALDSEMKIYAWALMDNHVHLLLRSGSSGLPHFMRHLLTWYAQKFNWRHQRSGHLFQNRYRSIVCDEEVYFQELVRYIHLNPMRAKFVEGLEQLNRYPWSGHKALMGNIQLPWQETDYVLSSFGKRSGQARKMYASYVSEGLNQGNRPELVGGGLVRSLGGWSAVTSMRLSKTKALTDARVLGTDDFVQKILEDTDSRRKRSFPAHLRPKRIEQIIAMKCNDLGTSVQELKMGSRRGRISQIRSDLACALIEEIGIPFAEVARHLGVSTSAISQIVRRREGTT